MKILGLSIILLSAYFYFSPKKEQDSQLDAIQVKASAPKRSQASASKNLVKERPAPEEKIVEEVSEAPLEADPTEEMSESFNQGVSHDDSVIEQSSTDPEQEWENQLRDSLSNLDPEYGEDIYNSYQKEKDSYQSELNAVIRMNQANQNLDSMIDEIEARHEDRVKEILGSHYEELKDQQSHFLESYNSSTGQ